MISCAYSWDFCQRKNDVLPYAYFFFSSYILSIFILFTLIICLGCGKTLTAEAIAELLEKPLYIVTAGDLGISAAEVEKNLGSVLELCQTCTCILSAVRIFLIVYFTVSNRIRNIPYDDRGCSCVD